MQRVFIPQITEHYDTHARRFVPTFDFSSAAVFGQLTPILDRSDDSMFLPSLMGKIGDVLADFQPDDYFIAVGDPSVIAACSGFIFQKWNAMKMLKWDKQLKQYIQLEIEL